MGSCEHGNEPSGSIKGMEFVDYLSDYWILKTVSVPCSYRRNFWYEVRDVALNNFRSATCDTSLRSVE